ncbi:MAG: hypothetical protein HXY28_05465 [Hydrogenophilaceae bacterium]|jgi:hypothetical protein|nr:hypothetical protein [Hydrogenophilaceae bacterium]
MAMTMHSEGEITPPQGKAKRAYAQAQTLREAAELLIENAEGKGARLPPRFNDKDLWRPE